MSDLRIRMQRELELCGLAESSQRVYLAAVTRLARHFKRSPAQLTTRDIQDYWLTLRKRLHPSSLRGRTIIMLMYGAGLRVSEVTSRSARVISPPPGARSMPRNRRHPPRSWR